MTVIDVLAGAAATGRFGPVFIAASWADVTGALGEPTEIGPLRRGRRRPRLFAYGDLEIQVCRCRRVTLVCVQTWRDRIELPVSISDGEGVFPGGLTRGVVVGALERAGCRWEPDPGGTVADQSAIVVPSTGVTFTFEVFHGEEPVLNVVGIPGDGHSCPAEGQN